MMADKEVLYESTTCWPTPCYILASVPHVVFYYIDDRHTQFLICFTIHIHIYVSQTLNQQRQCAKVIENNHHLSQSQGGVLWFLTKLQSIQLTTAQCWFNFNIIDFINSRHFSYRNIEAKFQYYIDSNIKNLYRTFLTIC